jgi:hypothetical protein
MATGELERRMALLPLPCYSRRHLLAGVPNLKVEGGSISTPGDRAPAQSRVPGMSTPIPVIRSCSQSEGA